MKQYPNILFVDTSLAPLQNRNTSLWRYTLDYHVYRKLPRLWQKIEELVRFDIFLALKAKEIANQFDIVFAGSERVGVPLAYLIINKPLVTLAHHLASGRKKKLLKYLGVCKKWSRVGYLSHADRDFIHSYFNVPLDKMFKYIAAPLKEFLPGPLVLDGPILSIGVSHRDYRTLIDALQKHPECQTDIYAGSRYMDLYRGKLADTIPDWINFKPYVPLGELAQQYKLARFVVLPLLDTTQFSAGCSTALEAHAAGKAVIATHTRGMSDYVIHGETGLLVPPYDTNALRNAILELWHNPDLAYRMGMAGRQHVEANFNPVDSVNNTRRMFVEVFEESFS